MTITPSHRLKSGVAATVKSVTTKSGALKFDVHDKLSALMQLGSGPIKVLAAGEIG
jgi:hypothetical protein